MQSQILILLTALVGTFAELRTFANRSGHDEEYCFLDETDIVDRCSGATAERMEMLIKSRMREFDCGTKKGCVALSLELKRWAQAGGATGNPGGIFSAIAIKKTYEWAWSMRTEGIEDENGEEIYCETEGVDKNGEACFATLWQSSERDDNYVPNEDPSFDDY